MNKVSPDATEQRIDTNHRIVNRAVKVGIPHQRPAGKIAGFKAAVHHNPNVHHAGDHLHELAGQSVTWKNPGTWTAVRQGRAPLHVDAAARAALLAVKRGAPGVYNIAEADGAVSIDKARAELGFDPSFRLGG